MKWILITILTFHQINVMVSQIILDSLKIVDHHVHFFSPELISNLETQGLNLNSTSFQIKHSKRLDYSNPEIILKQNDCARIVLISTAYAYKDSSKLNSEQEFIIKENDKLRRIVDKYPDTFYGFYGLNPLKDFTFEELKRCHEKLKLHGLKLHFQGNNVDLHNLDHIKKLDQIFDYISKNKIPVLIHNNAWNFNAGIEYAELFINKILKKHKNLKIIFAHAGGGGGFFKYTKDFLETMAKYLKDERNNHEIFFELSTVVQIRKFPGSQDLKELEKLMRDIGYDRFLFASDYPVRNSETYINEMISKLSIDPKILKEIIERNIFE